MNGNKFLAAVLTIAALATACTKNEIVEPESQSPEFQGVIADMPTRAILSSYDTTTDPENPFFGQVWIGSETPFLYRLTSEGVGTKDYMKAGATYYNNKKGYTTLTFTPQKIKSFANDDKLFSLQCSSAITSDSTGPVVHINGTEYSLSGELSGTQNYYANTSLDKVYEDFYDRNIVNSSQMHKIAWGAYGAGSNAMKYHNLFSIVRIPMVFVPDEEGAKCRITKVEIAMAGCCGKYTITIPDFETNGQYNLSYSNTTNTVSSTVQYKSGDNFPNGGLVSGTNGYLNLDSEATNMCFNVLPRVYAGDYNARTGGIKFTYSYNYVAASGDTVTGSKTINVYREFDLSAPAVYTLNTVTVQGSSLHE